MAVFDKKRGRLLVFRDTSKQKFTKFFRKYVVFEMLKRKSNKMQIFTNIEFKCYQNGDISHVFAFWTKIEAFKIANYRMIL